MTGEHADWFGPWKLRWYDDSGWEWNRWYWRNGRPYLRRVVLGGCALCSKERVS
jgi:hypothetical protein